MGNRGVTAWVAVKEQPCICPLDPRGGDTAATCALFVTRARFCLFFKTLALNT